MQSIKDRVGGTVLLLILFIAIACSEQITTDSPPVNGVPVSRVTVIPDADTLYGIGAILDLSANAYGIDGKLLPDANIIWSSSDQSMAIIDSLGRVSARAVGTTMIVAAAACCDAADTAEVTIAADTTNGGSDPAIPTGLAVTVVEQRTNEVEYGATWSEVVGASFYEYSAGSNQGLWSVGPTITSDTFAAFIASRTNDDDESYFCVKSRAASGVSESTCVSFTVPSNASPPPQDSTEPMYDPATDMLIWKDNFEAYGGTMEMFDSYAVSGGPPALELDVSGGRSNGNAAHFTYPQGGKADLILERSFSAVNHLFVQYWFKMNRGDNPSYGLKWLIVRHDAEGWSNGVQAPPGCEGETILRYQFDFTREGDVLAGHDHGIPKFNVRAEWDKQCDGPTVMSPGTGTGYFVWGPDSQESAPVLLQDPKIDNVPWDPVNDGDWHRHTVEIRAGAGLNGYARAWLDGHLYWDSSEGPMNFPGRPDLVKLFGNPAFPFDEGFQVWLDDYVIWAK